ncbi:MAG: glutathione S-transferase family protein [Algicola sp.]|nr:glutathione S-transferase family protein [Algicola sp.]
MKLHGAIISPNVRKVIVTCLLKGIDFESITVIPGPDLKKPEFLKLNPLGMIPVLEDDDLTIGDSNIIMQYLDDKYPDVSVYPIDVKDRARARWLSEYAGSALLPCCGVMFREVLVKPNYYKQPTDEQAVNETVNEKFPPVLDYLEEQTPATGLLFGEQICIADINVVSMLVTAKYGGYSVDGERWPKLSAYVHRVLSLPAFKQCLAAEKELLNKITA